MSTPRFAGRIAIVTGAGRGMGRAVAVSLAGGGASVIVNDVRFDWAESTTNEIIASGGVAEAWAADVSVFDEIQLMVSYTLHTFGTIDILVNNAGVLGSSSVLEDISVMEWDSLIGINVRGVFNCTKAVLPTMKHQRYGKIVNVSSSAGRSTSTFGGAHYTTSKAAVLGLTRHTAREAAPFNINVNATAPGSMDTEMVRERATETNLEQVRLGIPMLRFGTVQDQANLVAFLCSDEASYIAGATIDINGAELLL